MNSNNINNDGINFSTFDTSAYHSTFYGNVNEDTNSSTSYNCNQLYPVNKLPEKYRHIFSNYTYFNKIQTKAIDTIFNTDKSVVVSSPIGSGKTVIFELAIIHFLETIGKFSNNLQKFKIIYVAPIKALGSERHEDWKNKFIVHGLKCIEITGDNEVTDCVSLISSYQLIITTPEKWDSMTKKFKEFKYQINMVKLFLIDDVHLINDGIRGATLEAIVSRMKIIPKISKVNDFTLRFVAVSATITNIEDIAKWLTNDQNYPAHYLKSAEDERPVKLQKIVLGYNFKANSFKFDFDLTYKLKPLIRQYSNGRPTLIFCSTRKSVEFTCSILVKDITVSLSIEKQSCINKFSKEINNNKIKEMFKFGIGCHHAGMSIRERSVTEKLFRIGCLNILIATSTLAMDINLSAHLVIIKSTEYYSFNEYKEYNECQILQMVGRAGRPQFDRSATAIIMTKISLKSRYEKMLMGNQFIESHLHKYLTEHMNAEIFLGTIYNVKVVMDWIRSTFLYVRACKSPQNYGMIKTFNVQEVENKLQNLCLTEIKALACTGLINFLDGNNDIISKPECEIMAKYSISYATMKKYMQLKGTENLSDMINLLSHSKEFEYIKLRRTEKAALNILNKNKLPGVDVLRFPIEEGINTRETKITCLLQAILGTLKITDSSLAQDANKIIIISTRLTKALREIMFKGTKFEIARVACILAKCVTTKLWEQSKFVSKLIPRVGQVLSRDFVLNGKTTLKSIRDTDPRDLERFLNRQPPFGNHIHKFISQIPKYKVRTSFDKFSELVIVTLILIDHDNISSNVLFQTISVLVGDSENRLLKAQQIRNEKFLEQGGVIQMTTPLQNNFFLDMPNYEIIICLISDYWVGIDIEIKFKPGNHEEHAKESMSEENYDDESPESPLKNFHSPPPKKKRNFREVKQGNKDKTQLNIKKYLHNITSKDQDPKVMNKLCVEEDTNTDVKRCANESSVATRRIAGEMFKTQTNFQNPGQSNEYFKFNKDDLNNYFCYDELINDDVFGDLFVPEDNNHVISKAFDSAIEKCCFRERVIQTNSLKNQILNEVIEPMQSRCSRKDSCLNEKLEYNKLIMEEKSGDGKVVVDVHLPEFNQITCKNINRYKKDQLLANKENFNPYKLNSTKKRLPFDVIQKYHSESKHEIMSIGFDVKQRHFSDLKSTNKNRYMLSSRTSTTNMSQTDVVFEQKFEQNFSTINNEHVIPNAAVGRLSRLIENNLKAPSDFLINQDTENLPEVTEIHRREYLANTFVPVDRGSMQQNRPEFEVSAAPTALTPRHSNCFGGKTTLDKYFRAVKTSRRLRDLNSRRLSVAVSDVSAKSLVEKPSSDLATQQKTDPKDEKLLFTKHFLNHNLEESRETYLYQTVFTLLFPGDF
ncbi:probable ATP-dependent DNA helicase HFM1 [Rhopalosiphum maidis]|uniref:probable ATP-dependent DNA helicase HFM1 n=1 Tax=Rhopalosiphum maidis TaxID=43146 RepID=UPI000EFEFB8C|nr:probable ATP-dependent DNA helicase HFM1 [Rhopalosiphum maidis]